MATINLRDFYPWYTHDEFIEVSDEIAAELLADKRYHKAHDRRMRRNKAYSLDIDADMETAALACHTDNPEAIFAMMERHYANGMIEELDAKRQSLLKTIADMTAVAVSPNKLNQISGYLNDWANVDITDRRFVVDGLINQINITSETVKIEWKI